MECRWWPPALVLGAVLSGGCERSDPLSAMPNPAGTAMLTDMAIGDDSRAICVTRTLREPCNFRRSEILIDDVEDFDHVTATWAGDDLVIVDVVKGTVRRRADRSRDGRVAIRLNLNAQPPRIRLNYPGGTTTVPRPRP